MLLQKIRKHLTPAMGVAFLALILAVTGVSFAATGGVTSGASAPAKATAAVRAASDTSAAAVATTAKSSKPTKGKTGPRGPKGATGPAGPAGKNGANGATGPAGAAGAPGAAGSNGTGVTSTPIEPGEVCVKGGVMLIVGGKETPVCNGEKGTRGTPGIAGAPGAIHPGNPVGSAEPLPPEATETGAWKIEGTYGEGEDVRAIASFPIPLAESGEDEEFLSKSQTEENPRTTKCQGTAEHPTAPPGYFCVYTKQENNSSPLGNHYKNPLVEGEFSPAGALLEIETGEPETGPQSIQMWGTWAVTACTEYPCPESEGGKG
jgi:Collagen triple helix repeat (20 copies)